MPCAISFFIENRYLFKENNKYLVKKNEIIRLCNGSLVSSFGIP